MDELSTNAIAAAVEVAASLGLGPVTPRLLRDGANVLVHLGPAPVVARVATTTGLLRHPVENWLRRDVALAGWLHAAGAPVVAPSCELPPGPHRSSPATGSLAVSFWTYVEVLEGEASPQEAMASLGELHRLLAGYPGPSSGPAAPFLGVILDEIPHWLHWLETRRLLSGYDLIELREAHWRLARELRPGRHQAHRSVQALHGDAHRRNLLRTRSGLLWTDFEDTCAGPVAWDIASLVWQEVFAPTAAGGPAVIPYAERAEKAEALLALYPGAPSLHELGPYFDARELEAVVYRQALASRFPERARAAAQALEAWQQKRPRQ